MAEIRANREYKFKEFCISEEIPKSPPIKTKRWTFHDTNPNSRFYNRPVQRKWDEKDSSHINWPIDTNINQQYVKPYKKPESDLRAEFFNAYKKYYRRVDIKRLEVQSTLNVDAKYKGTDESVEGESSLYKEKECMEINIVMDTEKDDALVSSKVRRTVLCVSPGEEGSVGKENIKPDKMIDVPEELAIGDQNTVLGDTVVDESGYCSSHNRSNCPVTDLPVTSDQKHSSQENHPNMPPRLKQEQCSMNRAFVNFSEMPQNSNNIESRPGKHLLQSSDKLTIFNDEQFSSDSCNDIAQTTDLLASDTGSSACFSLNRQVASGNNSTVPGEIIQKDEKNDYVKREERTFYNSKMKPNTKDPVYPTPIRFRNPDENFSRAEVFHNRKKSDFKRSMGSGYINCEDVTTKSISSRDSEILPNAQKSLNIDSNSKNVDQYEPKSDPGEILTVREPLKTYHTNQSVSDDYNFVERTTGSIKRQDKNHNNNVSIFRTESAQESPRNKIVKDTKSYIALTSEDEFSKPESCVRFRGLRGTPFDESNKKVLKSLVVKVVQSDSNNDEKVIKRHFNSFPQKDRSNLTQGHENKEVSNLERRETNPEFRTSSHFSYCNPVNSSYNKLKVPETFQNITKRPESSSDSKNFCSEERSYTTAGKENIEEPFVIWTNKNRTDHIESLQINKLTVSDNDSDIGSGYDTNSNLQSFSDWYSVRETPVSSTIQRKVNKQDYQDQSQISEKWNEKKHFREVPKNLNETERKENENEGTDRQFPERRYSNITSVPNKNCALPKYHSYGENSKVLDSYCAKEDRKSEICHGKVTVSSDEKGDWMDKKSRVVSQRNYTKESFNNKRSKGNIKPNGCIVGECQLTDRVTRTYDKNKIMDESSRIRNGQEEYASKKNFSKQVPNEYNVEQYKINFNESNGCDKKISKSSNSDFLQIGPTYSVHYTPAHNTVLRTDQQKNYDETWKGEELDDRCDGGPANAFHCSHGNDTDFIRKNRNETLSRNGCNHSPSMYCDNYINTCRHEIICNACYKPNSDINSSGYHNSGNDNCCDCENLNRGSSYRIMKNNNVCLRHRDTNLHFHSRNSYSCPMSNKHRKSICCPCQEGNSNNCQECGDEQMRFLFKECSANFQKANNLLCSCPRRSTEIKKDAVCTRKGKCCGARFGNEKMNPCLLRGDRERQWMATGHQPMRNANKIPVDTNIERSEESFVSCIVPNNVKEPFMKEFGNHCPINPLYNDDHCNTKEYSSPDNNRRNNSFSYDEEVENICHKSTKNDSVRNHSLRDIKTERKCYHNPVDGEEVTLNYPGRADNSAIQDESKGPATKLIPEKKIYYVQKTKQFSSEGENLCITDPLNSYDGKTKGTEVPLKGSDRSINEPLFLCEEQWDTDDGLPMRRVIRKVEERKEEKGDSTCSENEPIYLREEHWGSDDEEIGADKVYPRDSRSRSVRYLNDMNCLWKGQRSVYNQPAGRIEKFSEGEESRKCSSVHAVSDPSFHCEQQWASDEEKCENHKFQSTLPKNRTKKKKGRDRRSFNPRRWEMVTDLPKNEYIAKQNRNKNGQNNYEDGNFGDTMVFQNRKYYSNNEQ